MIVPMQCRILLQPIIQIGREIRRNPKPALPNGNVLLDELLDARIHWIQLWERVAKLRELPDWVVALGMWLVTSMSAAFGFVAWTSRGRWWIGHAA